MSTLPPDILIRARQLRQRLALGLPPVVAKLYSQYTRIRELQPGLSSWSISEAETRFAEALQLVDAALAERDAGNEMWRTSARRAAEMLEWLSQPEVLESEGPLRLLAAAVYQVAGYPARAAGVLRDIPNDRESLLIRAFLQADFADLLYQLTNYWSISKANVTSNGNGSIIESSPITNVEGIITEETASVLGLLSAAMRWGEEERTTRAVEKLAAIASLMLHSHDRYSWLLARLCVEVAEVYRASALRTQCAPLLERLGVTGRAAFERYYRISYLGGKALCWPSQIRGIQRLTESGPFVLCTPTGSGKTTVAELAILASLFAPERGGDAEVFGPFERAPLVLYLVPSRALAAEVEAKLARVVRRLEEPRITVTGLYGGTDWGPSDAWLTNNERVVLIATYEKAEALVRFLGSYFISRVSLVVLDEAHAVQFDRDSGSSNLAESRALRLEALGARLFARLDPTTSRVIALSAVARGIESALAGWIAGREGANAETITYRSTRQIVGRLECLPNHSFEIQYDILDGTLLQFGAIERRDAPYIPNPFRPHPPAPQWTTEKYMERRLIPSVLWAAMNFAAPDARGIQRGVLVSIPQDPQVYADAFLLLLDDIWAHVERPPFFTVPKEGEQLQIWNTCLRACADYFGIDSHEYRLLNHGIVFHHGKMPGSLARLLIDIINQGIIHLVAATSTLSEGVNLPFETILIASLKRWNGDLSPQEFGNLVGRAGRPGHGTEGRTLVLLERSTNPRHTSSEIRQSHQRYERLVTTLQTRSSTEMQSIQPSSALAELLVAIERTWQQLTGIKSRERFLAWLEQISPNELQSGQEASTEYNLGTTLDTLDSILLSAIVEVEELPMAQGDHTDANLEDELQRIWQLTYARYATAEEANLAKVFTRRGVALTQTIYPERKYRRRLYRTGLPPKAGATLLSIYSSVYDHLMTGTDYVRWTAAKRFTYIMRTVELLSQVPSFAFGQRASRRKVDFRHVLLWWLDPKASKVRPAIDQRANWHRYVSTNFTYRFNWGLGSVIALALEDAFGESRPEPSLEQWPSIGLPWIVFWIKELTTWGTLDPVAASLMAQGYAQTRPDAETAARDYYLSLDSSTSVNEVYNASTIRSWCLQLPKADKKLEMHRPPLQIRASLQRDPTGIPTRRWRVMPMMKGSEIVWLDPAGFELAVSPKPETWPDWFITQYDFVLDLDSSMVIWGDYVSTQIPLSRS